MVAFGGDQAALFETIVGLPPPENKTSAAPANIDAMLEDTRKRTGAEPAYAALSHYGRADSTLTVFTYPSDGELINHNLMYDTASGAFLREKPSLGLVPSIGGASADLMGPLHFGNFAGVLSKSVWFALGFAACFVVLSGLLLWTTRRAESAVWRRMERLVTWMGFGLPLCLAAVPYGYFFGRANAATELEPPMVVALLTTVIAVSVAALPCVIQPCFDAGCCSRARPRLRCFPLPASSPRARAGRMPSTTGSSRSSHSTLHSSWAACCVCAQCSANHTPYRSEMSPKTSLRRRRERNALMGRARGCRDNSAAVAAGVARS